MKSYFFSSESVSEGHPDKVADQISDAILDEFLAHDPESKVACETLVTTGQVVIAGEVRSRAYIDLMDVTRRVIKQIGYDRSDLKFDGEACGVLSALHEQSVDINRGVDRENREDQGAGDQGMMFGFACNETDSYMPLTIYLAHRIMEELAAIRHEGKEMTYLRPDSKSQVTVEYDENGNPLRVDTIVVSTQHDEFILPGETTTQDEADELMRRVIEQDVREILIPRLRKQLPEKVNALWGDDFRLLVNPTGKFVIGGPHGDTGLTGRKIIVDTYGGHGAHGGGAFSGKDPSKVDRSAAYAARHIAKNLVHAGVADSVLVQVAYAIGCADPVSLCVDTRGTSHVDMSDSEIAEVVKGMKCFNMRPYEIEKRFDLRKPIYAETAAYGHVGREPIRVIKHFESKYEGPKEIEVELFSWERLDAEEDVKKAFGLA